MKNNSTEQANTTQEVGLHTKGEWVIDEATSMNKGLIGYAISNQDRDQLIARVEIDDNLLKEEAKANAKRIVQCCNAHDELVAALRSCYRALTLDSDMEEDFAEEIAEAKAALDLSGWT